MRAGIISIGDELLSGKTVNSNAAFISSQLLAIGIPTTEVRTVGDNYYQIIRVLREFLNDVDVIVVTGGLGPTHDDITKKALTDFFDGRLIFHEDLFNRFREWFERTGRHFPESNRDQAIYPDNAELISNRLGTAQGMIFRKGSAEVYVLPGVPSEMKAMIRDTVIPRLKSLQAEKIDSLTVRTTGIAESALFDQLGEWAQGNSGYSVAFLPDLEGVDIRITARAETDEKLQELFQKVKADLNKNLGDYIYGEGSKKIEEVIAEILTDRKLTISVAESCTGGLIAHRFTNISGSSEFFERGVVSYSNAAKVEILKVSEKTLFEHGAVSDQTALEMAEGIRRLSGTDIGLSVTGIAGPTGDTPEKPIGLVYMGLAVPEGTIVWKRIFGKVRFQNKMRFSQAALDMLRRYLFFGLENPGKMREIH